MGMGKWEKKCSPGSRPSPYAHVMHIKWGRPGTEARERVQENKGGEEERYGEKRENS